MHASRMRTARSLAYRGVSMTETPPDRDPQDRDPSGTETLWTETPGQRRPWDRELPDGDPPCEQNDRQVQKYYLAQNFVGGG